MPDRRKRVRRIILFPRHTALYGASEYRSAVLDVRAFEEVLFTGWQGTGLGTTPATVQFTVQQSTDLEVWADGTSFSPSGGDSEVTASDTLYFPWLRVKAVVTGTDPGVTCWLVGDFVLREGASAEEAA